MQAHFGFQTGCETPRVAILHRRKRADAKVARFLSNQRQIKLGLFCHDAARQPSPSYTSRRQHAAFLHRSHVDYFCRRSFFAVVDRAISIRRRMASGRPGLSGWLEAH
jgi:hypothetical protein